MHDLRARRDKTRTFTRLDPHATSRPHLHQLARHRSSLIRVISSSSRGVRGRATVDLTRSGALKAYEGVSKLMHGARAGVTASVLIDNLDALLAMSKVASNEHLTHLQRLYEVL